VTLSACQSGDAPFESGDAPFESGDAPLAVDPSITGNTVTGQPAMERIGFNWLRQARSELIGSDVTVLILDTLPVQGGIDVAQEYVDFWVDWVGDQSVSAPHPARSIKDSYPGRICRWKRLLSQTREPGGASRVWILRRYPSHGIPSNRRGWD
jgi:hypothetical protein